MSRKLLCLCVYERGGEIWTSSKTHKPEQVSCKLWADLRADSTGCIASNNYLSVTHSNLERPKIFWSGWKLHKQQGQVNSNTRENVLVLHSSQCCCCWCYCYSNFALWWHNVGCGITMLFRYNCFGEQETITHKVCEVHCSGLEFAGAWHTLISSHQLDAASRSVLSTGWCRGNQVARARFFALVVFNSRSWLASGISEPTSEPSVNWTTHRSTHNEA